MAQLTLTIPDAQLPRILSAFTARRPLGVSGETPNAVVRNALIAFIKEIVVGYEADAAADTARRAATDSANRDLSIS